MSIQKVLRTFRSSISPTRRAPVPLDEEVALYRRRAEIALEEERFQDALVFLAKVLRLNPYDLPSRMLVAQTYHYGLHEVEKALMTYEKVVASAAYDDSNTYCAVARTAIRELGATVDADPTEKAGTAVATIATIATGATGATAATVATVATVATAATGGALPARVGGAASSRVDFAGIVNDESGELPQTVAL